MTIHPGPPELHGPVRVAVFGARAFEFAGIDAAERPVRMGLVHLEPRQTSASAPHAAPVPD
jgi:hypothetical protein